MPGGYVLRKDGRVVDYTGLENRRAERLRGFESLSFRAIDKRAKSVYFAFFVYNDMEYKMVAKTFKGLEEVLARELVELGANEIQIDRRAVSFMGDKALMYRANLCLRTASRILKPILSFHAKNADEVYEKVKSISWEKYMNVRNTFAIDATVYSESFRHSAYVTYRVKDGIADYFSQKVGARPSVKVSQPDIMINVHISGEDVTISRDSSGESLHKRGWREASTEAPINEALAAGLLLLSGWKGQSDLYDPMCGSGTFLIEAALIALGIAPGIYRKSFGFEKWPDFDAELFNEIYNDDSSEKNFDNHIYGSDASFYCTKVAEKNIIAARLQKYISVRMCRIQDLKTHSNNAFIIMNPPYGQRLSADSDVCKLYKEIGNVLKKQFAGSSAWIISSNEDAMKSIGLKPSKRIPILNGDLECRFNQYELFVGEHKEYKKALAEGTITKRQESEYKHHTYLTHKRSVGAKNPKYSHYKRDSFDNNDVKMRPFDASNKQKSFHRKNEERRDSNYEKDTD